MSNFLKIKFVQCTLPTLCGFELLLDLNSIREISIGRSPENIIVIPDPTVSRKHALITKNGDRVIIKDLGSKNGTYVLNNGEFQRINEYVIDKEVTLRLGLYTVIKVEQLNTF